MSPFMSSGSGSALSVIVWAILIFMVVGYMLYRFAIVTVLRKHLHALPAEYQEPPEAVIWMSIIPGVPCLVNFFIFPMLTGSYRKALEAKGVDEERRLLLLTVAAWLYPCLYLGMFLPYVAPGAMPTGVLNSQMGFYFYMAMMYGDILVLIFMATQFDALGKHFRAGKPGHPTQPDEPTKLDVHPRRANVLKWLSRDHPDS